MSAFKIPQMLLVLAKEIFEWCLVAEDIIVLAQKKIYISLAPPPPPPPPPRSQQHLEISDKMESFPSYGSRINFFTIFEAILFLVPLLSHFIFFLHIKNQNIFLDKNPAPPPPTSHPKITKWSVPYAVCEQQRRRSACASAQSDQHLCCSLPRLYDIFSIYIGNFMTLTSFFSWADRFESYLVENPEDRFFSWRGSYGENFII